MLETEFEQLLLKYKDIIGIRSRFSGLVKDLFPGKQMQINLILAAYDLEIAKELEVVKAINNSFAYRFVKRLVDEYGISRANADWVVSLWCVCYGHKILKKPCDIKLSSGEKGKAPSITDEQKNLTKYGDLFRYEQSSCGNGLAVSGFLGSNNKTIIFQNAHQNIPVVEIKTGAFSESAIEEVVMTDGFIRIGERAFWGCNKLRQIILPQSLHELCDYALAGCKELKSISLPLALEQIGSYALSGTGIKSIQIPKSVYWIGEGAFSECNNLDDIKLEENIGSITKKMFYKCCNLKKISLHEQVSSIGDLAFAGCTSLMNIYIPESITSIGINAFDNVNEKFILMCSVGSYAEIFARQNKLRYQLV